MELDVKYRIWIFSDLQQSIPENAKYCLSKAVEDFKRLEMDCKMIWYLGDAVEGSNMDFLKQMAKMQIETIGTIGIPIRYVLGNHDFDYYNFFKEKLNKVELPFYNAIHNNNNWKTIENVDSFYFIEDIGDFIVVFLSDHASNSGEWSVQHGNIYGDTNKYPHDISSYLALKSMIDGFDKPTIIASHYSFAGGNRPSQLFNQLLPLSENVKVHFYGHAHIGDMKWGGKECYRKISSVDNQNIPQINVSSLENRRGDAIRSVILEVYKDNTLGICFRNHTNEKWDEYYMINSSTSQQ